MSKRGSSNHGGITKSLTVHGLCFSQIARVYHDGAQDGWKNMCGTFTSRKNRLHQRFTSIAAVASGIWSKYRNSDIASWISAICMDLSKVVIHGYKKKKKKTDPFYRFYVRKYKPRLFAPNYLISMIAQLLQCFRNVVTRYSFIF